MAARSLQAPGGNGKATSTGKTTSAGKTTTPSGKGPTTGKTKNWCAAWGEGRRVLEACSCRAEAARPCRPLPGALAGSQAGGCSLQRHAHGRLRRLQQLLPACLRSCCPFLRPDPPYRSADANCASCGTGGQCTACTSPYALQGTRCVRCDGANMKLVAATKTKGARCECE